MSWTGTLQGYTRRKTISILSLTVPDYQMKLTIHKNGLGPDTSTDIYLGGNCRTDFADIRFTEPNGITLINHWIESYNTGDWAIIWIKVPTLLPTNQIYIYYDNPSATDASNGQNTFDLFEDFEGISTPSQSRFPNFWNPASVCAGNESIVVDNTIGTGNALQIVAGCPSLAYSNITFSNFAVDLITNIISYLEAPYPIVIRSQGANNNGYWVGYEGGTARWFLTDNNRDAPWLASWTSGVSATGVHKFTAEVNGSNINVYIDNILRLTTTGATTYSSGYIGFGTYGSGAPTRENIDNVRIRKYISPGPTFGVTGIEEPNVTPNELTLNTNTCLGTCSITAGVTWQNLGNADITFSPAVEVDGGTPDSFIVYGPNIIITAGGTSSTLITTPVLSVGIHTVCPFVYPYGNQ